MVQFPGVRESAPLDGPGPRQARRNKQTNLPVCRRHGIVSRAAQDWHRRMQELGWPEQRFSRDSKYAKWEMPMDGGTLGILNVGAGDTKLTFDKDKPADREKAAKAVQDMLRLGYAIMIQVGVQDGKPLYQRCDGFDPATCEYIIMGVRPEEVDLPAEMKRQDPPPQTGIDDGPAIKGKRGRRPSTRVKAEGTSAVGVARSAGG